MPNGVSFDGLYSYDDFDLWLSNRPDFGSPEPKLNKVEIPGADGILDLTEANAGEAKFNNRIIVVTFALMVNIQQQASYRRALMNAFHGKKFNRIIFDEDPNWYWTGRVTVKFIDVLPWKMKIVFTIDAAPYAMKINETVVNLMQGTSSVNEISFGQDTSIMNFNSDIRMGTRDFPDGIPVGGLSDLIISWPENPTTVGSYIEWQVVDADDHVFNSSFTYPRPAGADPTSIRTPLADIENAGVDLSKVYRILVSGIGGCTASIEKQTIRKQVINQRKAVIPFFTLDAQAPVSIVVNGKSAEVPVGGPAPVDGIILKDTDNEIYSSIGTDVQSFTMTFREGRL